MIESMKTEVRPWGSFTLLYETPSLWIKTITINPQSRLSLQVHEHRDEIWVPHGPGCGAIIGDKDLMLLPNQRYRVKAGTSHRLYNSSWHPVIVTEIATGMPDERDIVRLQDDYSR